MPYKDKDKKKAWDRARPKAHAGYHLMKTYGLTLVARDAMLEGPGGGCAVCGTPTWGKLGPCVDHDHTTGDIRGILCCKCNAAAGYLDDNPNKARMLVTYLEKRLSSK